MKISEHECQTNENSYKNDENTYHPCCSNEWVTAYLVTTYQYAWIDEWSLS